MKMWVACCLGGMLALTVVAPGSRDACFATSAEEMAGDESSLSGPRPDVEGHWEGAIETPGSPLGILVDLEYSDGEWMGTIDIPAQGAAGFPLSAISVRGNEIGFGIRGVPGEPTFSGDLNEGRITGAFSQAGQTFGFELGRERLEKPLRPQEPRPPYPYKTEGVSYHNGDIELAGTLTLPAGEGPFPAVLLISGSGPQNRDEEIFGHKPFLVLADYLTRAGIAVLRVDDRGVGQSTGDRSLATSEDYAGDALAGVEFLLGRPEIDPARIGLAGHSEGGIIAPMVALRSDAVAFIVLLAATGVRGDLVLERQMELISRAEGMDEKQLARVLAAQRALVDSVKSGAGEEEVEARVRDLVLAQTGADSTTGATEDQIVAQTRVITSPWFRFFLGYDPRPALEKLRIPVLALFGEHDLQVDPKQNLPAIRLALEKAGNDDYTVEELPGLNHLFQQSVTGSPDEYYSIEETFDPKALEVISSWITKRFVK